MLDGASDPIEPAVVLLEGCDLESPDIGRLTLGRAKQIAAYVESNLGQPLQVPMLARLAGLSTSHFSRTFRCRFGITVRGYVWYRRIQHAKRCMRDTDDSLADIALQCGMADQAHFSKVFRRVEGVPPGQWRQTQRAQS